MTFKTALKTVIGLAETCISRGGVDANPKKERQAVSLVRGAGDGGVEGRLLDLTDKFPGILQDGHREIAALPTEFMREFLHLFPARELRRIKRDRHIRT